MLYYSLIYPYFCYCNVVWASTYKTNLRCLAILQKRIIRIIYNKSHFNAHTDPIFKDLGTLKFNDIHFFNWASLCIFSKIHSYLQGLITISPKAINSTLTIHSQAYRLPYCRTNTKKFSPFLKGLSFLIHLTTRSSTLNPFPFLRKN